MAAVKKGRSKFNGMMRVSPLKPGLRGSQNWMAAQMRAAKHSPKALFRFVSKLSAPSSLSFFWGFGSAVIFRTFGEYEHVEN